jgi:hypothetical protein
VKRSGFSPPRTAFCHHIKVANALRDPFEKHQASNNPLAWHNSNLAQKDVSTGLVL